MGLTEHPLIASLVRDGNVVGYKYASVGGHRGVPLDYTRATSLFTPRGEDDRPTGEPLETGAYRTQEEALEAFLESEAALNAIATRKGVPVSPTDPTPEVFEVNLDTQEVRRLQ